MMPPATVQKKLNNLPSGLISSADHVAVWRERLTNVKVFKTHVLNYYSVH